MNIYILLLIILLMSSLGYVNAQEFADKDYYLIDSLVLEDLSEYEVNSLDKQLKAYHAESSFHKLTFLDSIVDQTDDYFIWESYGRLFKDEANKYINEFKEDSEEVRLAKTYYANAIKSYGNFFHYVDESDSAIYYFEKALDLYRELEINQGIGTTMNSLAFLFLDKDMFYESIEMANESLNFLDTNEISTCVSLCNYGVLQRNLYNYNEALYFQNLALKVAENLNDKENTFMVLTNIAAVKRLQENIDEADSIIHVAISLMEEMETYNPYNYSYVKEELGFILIELNKLDEAQSIFEELLSITKENNFIYSYFIANVALSDIALLKEEFLTSKVYATTAYDIANEYNRPDVIVRCLENLIPIAAYEKDFELAFKYQKTLQEIVDERRNDEKTKAVLKQSVEFQFEKQKAIDDLKHEQEIALADAQKQKTRIGMISAILIALIVGIASFFIYNRLQVIKEQKVKLDDAYFKLEESKKNELAVSNLKALQSQMNPHFIFNALNSVQDLVLLKDIRNSNKFLGKFSDLIRKILLSSKEQFISLEEEIEILGLYLDLEKLRFGDEFIIDFSCDVSQEKQEEIQLPAMFIQPYIENAIKHGLFSKKGAKKLSVAFSLPDINTLQCIVQDNGIGQKQAAIMKEQRLHLHTGFSTEAINERIRLLNQTVDKKINLQIIDLEENGVALGTKIVLYFPL